jgi:hypothetical protein
VSINRRIISLAAVAAVAAAVVAPAAGATAGAHAQRTHGAPVPTRMGGGAPAARLHGRPSHRRGVKAAAVADYSSTWTDAVLDCYPPGGGIVGGGPYNNSVSLAINWHSPDNATRTARFYVWFEEYWNGSSGAVWQTPDNGYVSSTPGYGPVHITPSGTTEFQKVYRDPIWGGTTVITDPWSRIKIYPKSSRVVVRAMVGLQTLGASGYGPIVWWPARTRSAALGYKAGFCAL